MIERPDSEILINYLSFTRAILFKVCLLKRDIPTSLDITKCTQLQFVDVWRCSLINVAAFFVWLLFNAPLRNIRSNGDAISAGKGFKIKVA